ncbi:MAG: Mur ligase family protein, partial [Defluviitaleaceae bacterium]|nr:Mur ligase family protein [Defluviitaleaceae bacterium]
NSFHHWHPQVGIILNIDADHLDFFGSMENLIAAFGKFASNIRKEGALIIRAGVEGFDIVTREANCEIITFGLQESGARFTPRNINYKEGKPSFDIFDGENFLAHVDLPLPGEYNMLNALACFAAAFQLKIPTETTANALSNVQGTKRRFEHKGLYNGIKIIDDYAHHPTEIRSCLAAARQSINDSNTCGKLVCLFQPHTYTRTKNLLHDFAKSFTDADKVILLPIYAAREAYDPEISSEMLAKLIKDEGNDVTFIENFDKTGNYLKETLKPNDMLITMGAGDVYKVGEELLRTALSTLSTGCGE